MQVLVALNNDGNSKNNSDLCLTASGKEMDLNPRIFYLYQVNNVFCMSDGLNEEPAISMDIVENDTYGLLVSVASEEKGHDLMRKLGKEGYLDLSEYDVSIDSREKTTYL